MDHLWAPWRLSYVASAKPPAEGDACFLCEGLAAEDDRRNLVVLRAPLSVVVLNRFPYTTGFRRLGFCPSRSITAQANSFVPTFRVLTPSVKTS